MIDPIQWVALYNDSTSLHQYNEDGTENGQDKIERQKLNAFGLVRASTGLAVILVHFDCPGQRLVFRRRRFTKHYGDGVMVDENKGPESYWMIGWQRNVAGKNVQSICFVNEEGAIDMIGRWNNEHTLFGEPEWLPFESVTTGQEEGELVHG